MGDQARETAGTMTALIVHYVRRAGGDAAVARVLARAGVSRSIAELEDEANWTTYDEKVALWEAAAAELSDPIVSRHMGESVLDTNIGAPLRFLLRSFGSPRIVLANVARITPKFSTVAKMTATGTGRREMRLTYELDRAKRPHRLDCESNIGLISAVGPLFGLPLLPVEHPACQVDGAPRCVYIVRWPRWRRLRQHGRSRAHLHEQITSLTTQVQSLQSTAADLVSSLDTTEVLDHIVRRAASAVSAQRYVLAVRLREGGPLDVHSDGFPPGEDRPFGERLLTAPDCASAGDERSIVIDVASARRHYGRLAALYDDHAFFEYERRLLAAYARSAAVALDAAAAYDEARRRGETATALLDLARNLAVIPEPGQVAQQIADAMPPVLGTPMATVFILDRERNAFVLRGAHGLTAAQFESLAEVELRRGDDDPGLTEWLRGPEPVFTVRGGERAEVTRYALNQLDVDAMAAVPIRRHDELLGLASVYFTNAGAVTDPDTLLERMTAVADQAATALENGNLLERARHQATHDDLTGLPNRVLFENAAERALMQSRRSGEPVALLFVDLDGFKGVNDDHGHDAGDELLAEMARRLSEYLRDGDLVARLGGDEFTVLLPATTPEVATEIAERLRAALAAPVELASGAVTISACVGIAIAPDDGSEYGELLRAADTAMYRAKRLGRDRSARHDTDVDAA